MGRDFQIRELVGATGSGRFEVTARLTQSDPYCLSLGKSLIKTGALCKSGDLTFLIIGEYVYCQFRVLRGGNDEIFPRISDAQHVFSAAINNALKIRAVVQAISLADGQASKEGSR